MAFVSFAFTKQDAAHASLATAYEDTTRFIATHAATLGIPSTSPESLDTVSIELLTSLHDPASDPPLSFSKPPPPPASTLTFSLFSETCPKTVENFLRLCDGSKGLGKQSKKPLHYKGNRVHRVVEGYIVQWGDIVKGDGSSGESIYGSKFNDEPAGLKLPISRGSLVMANSGKHSNTSQVFVVLTRDIERVKKNMQGKHVVLGHVVGLEEDNEEGAVGAENRAVMARLDALKEGIEVVIRDCGVV
ncbi:hypothetical protein HDU98_005470 [Podochytrium sp. JEL0797]|nr:hypothetical protein HDU98_005470 [Podochytrium sp. JEL0797]